jgi:hypothetical protein
MFLHAFGMSGESLVDRETPLVGVVALETPPAGANCAPWGLGFDQHVVFLGMPATDRAGPAGKKLTLNELKFDPLSFHFLPLSRFRQTDPDSAAEVRLRPGRPAKS